MSGTGSQLRNPYVPPRRRISEEVTNAMQTLVIYKCNVSETYLLFCVKIKNFESVKFISCTKFIKITGESYVCVIIIKIQTCQYIKSISSVPLRVCTDLWKCVQTCTRDMLRSLLSEQHSGVSHVFLVGRQRGTATTQENRAEEGGEKHVALSRATRSSCSSSMVRRRVSIVINRDDL